MGRSLGHWVEWVTWTLTHYSYLGNRFQLLWLDINTCRNFCDDRMHVYKLVQYSIVNDTIYRCTLLYWHLWHACCIYIRLHYNYCGCEQKAYRKYAHFDVEPMGHGSLILGQFSVSCEDSLLMKLLCSALVYITCRRRWTAPCKTFQTRFHCLSLTHLELVMLST